jgi:hypothetical protein
VNRRLPWLVFLLAVGVTTRAAAQACCAGAAAVTPGRLAIHEDALVGAQNRLANVFGSFSANGTYSGAPSRTAEWDFEQALFGSLRLTSHGQISLLVPVVETYRRAGAISDFGGGLGDINLSGRYDFVWAGESILVPGIALLAGVTFPSGRPPESATDTLATDATGIGAYQANIGLALEQTTGPWLFGVTGLFSKRTTRTVGDVTTSLGSQWVALASAAYTWSQGPAVALVASYAIEGESEVNGANVPDSNRRMPLLTLAGLYPITDAWRLQGGAFFTPPISQLGKNFLAQAGIVIAVVRSWS